MRRHLRKPGVWIAALILLVAWLLWPRPVSSPPPTALPAASPTSADSAPLAVPPSTPAASPDSTDAGSTKPDPGMAALPAFLPDEAHDVIRSIQRGGPFEHRQDGGVFGNREGLLPSRPGGYYREYTVETPRLSHRGARRIITGGRPPEVWYYTDDHYDSFRVFQVTASQASAMERAR